MAKATLGIIGGSGLYELEGLSNIQKHKLDTPFGSPSDEYLSGDLGDTHLVFLPRHGQGHWITPSEINFRANIWGFKKLGVEWIMSVSAVGSLREDIERGDMVVPNQFFDRTRERISTFFGNGCVAHTMFGDPVCEILRKKIVDASKSVGAKTHDGGTYVNMEGPAFSTRAESLFYRTIDNAAVIGMTNLQEAKLAREAEISYATLALATDYDCWHQSEEDVNADMVVQVMKKNVATAKKILVEVAKNAPEGHSPFKGALKYAIVTDPSKIPAETREKLNLLIGPYV